MPKTSFRWLAVAAALAVPLSGCGHESGDDNENDGLTAPSSSSALPATLAPAPTPSPASPSPTPTPAPTPAPTGSAVAYDPDVKAILDARCSRCHASLGSYRGAMNYVRPGDAGSVLVQVTAPGGAMSRYLGTAAEAELIRQWVLLGAPERR